MAKKEWDEMSRKEKVGGMIGVVIIGIIAIFVIAGIIGAATGSKTETKEEAVVHKEEPKIEKKEEVKTEVKEITQRDAENACQDAAFIRKYTPESVSLISITKYTPVLMDYDDTTKNFSWSGKNNDTGDTVRFSCNVKVIDGKVTPISLAIDGESVYTRD